VSQFTVGGQDKRTYDWTHSGWAAPLGAAFGVDNKIYASANDSNDYLWSYFGGRSRALGNRADHWSVGGQTGAYASDWLNEGSQMGFNKFV
jgi:hypothetical protein